MTLRYLGCKECDRLRDRIEELERIIGTRDDEFPYKLPMQPKAQRMLLVLLNRVFVSNETAFVAICDHTDRLDSYPEKYVQQYITKVRAFLGPLRRCVKTKWGEGYYIMPQDKQQVRAYMESRICATSRWDCSVPPSQA